MTTHLDERTDRNGREPLPGLSPVGEWLTDSNRL